MITLGGGDAEMRIDPDAGGRVAYVRIGDLDLLAHAGAEVTHWGCFVMAPWTGRVRDGRFTHAGTGYELPTDLMPPHAIHGTVLDQPWSTVAVTATTAVLDCPLGNAWPWPGRVRHIVTLAETLAGGSAEFSLEVHADDEPFPASAGWHPWFRRRLVRGGPAEIGLDAGAMLARGADGLPSGERAAVTAGPWDDCFDGVRWPIVLSWPDALRLEIGADTRYAVVYDEHAQAVCVEPTTGPTDALNLEPVAVTPGRPLTARMTWSWRLDPPAR